MTENDYKQYINMYSNGVLRYLAKNLQDIDDAKDILQDTFIALWDNKDKIQNGKAKNWLFTTAHNRMLKLIRYRKVRQNTVNIDQEAALVQSSEKHRYDSLQQIDVLLQNLSETMKQCLMLKEWSGFSIKEIASIMQICEEYVKINIFRAKIKLRENTQAR